MINKYLKAISNGATNGYAYIDDLSDAQVEILGGIARAVSKKSYGTGREGLKAFTLKCSGRGSRVFDRYAENTMIAADELMAAN